MDWGSVLGVLDGGGLSGPCAAKRSGSGWIWQCKGGEGRETERETGEKGREVEGDGKGEMRSLADRS